MRILSVLLFTSLGSFAMAAPAANKFTPATSGPIKPGDAGSQPDSPKDSNTEDYDRELLPEDLPPLSFVPHETPELAFPPPAVDRNPNKGNKKPDEANKQPDEANIDSDEANIDPDEQYLPVDFGVVKPDRPSSITAPPIIHRPEEGNNA